MVQSSGRDLESNSYLKSFSISQQKANIIMPDHPERQIVASTSCGHGRFSLSVVNLVYGDTVFDDDGNPIDGFYTFIEAKLDSPDVGFAGVATHELNKGDFRKLANMFTKLAIKEEES